MRMECGDSFSGFVFVSLAIVPKTRQINNKHRWFSVTNRNPEPVIDSVHTITQDKHNTLHLLHYCLANCNFAILVYMYCNYMGFKQRDLNINHIILTT